MATEVVRSHCHPGRIPDDANSEAGQAWKDCMNTLLQTEGVQRVYWGREVENPDVMHFFVDWDSVEAHKAFQKTSEYKPFCDRLEFVLDFSKLEMYHVPFTPHPPTAALSDTSAPVTEIFNTFFPASYSDSDQQKFEDGLKKLVSAIESNSKAYRGSAGGWAEEEVNLPNSDSGDSEKGRTYLTLIGWDSVEDHMAFRNTDAFKECIPLIRGAKDLKGTSAVHASCVELTRGGGVGDDFDESVQEEILNPQQGGKQSVKSRADGTTTKNDGTFNALKKERQGR